MDNLEKELLLRNVETLGYPLMRASGIDPVKVIRQMLESEDARLLEGVPVVLVNALSKSDLELLHAIETDLSSNLKKRFRVLLAITLLYSFWLPDSERIRMVMEQYLQQREPSVLKSTSSRLQEEGKVSIGGGITLDASRLETVFKNYVVQEHMDTRASLEKKIETERHNQLFKALSILFTKKQIEILVKLMSKESLTKTEKEYYSRSIKPRLRAISNSDVQGIATTLAGQK